MRVQDVQELKRLAGKYYGYIVDMEGSGIEILARTCGTSLSNSITRLGRLGN